MRLSSMEQIDSLILDIRELLIEDDAYHISDAIISNIADPSMPDLIMEMLLRNGYESDTSVQVMEKVNEIVDLANSENEEAALSDTSS